MTDTTGPGVNEYILAYSAFLSGLVHLRIRYSYSGLPDEHMDVNVVVVPNHDRYIYDLRASQKGPFLFLA